MTRALERGATVHLPVAVLRAVLRWGDPPGAGRGGPGLDLSALLLDAGGRVRSQGDFVFYNQPRHPTGLVRRLPRRRDAEGRRETVEAELGRLDAGVRRVVLAASADGGFAGVRGARLLLHDAAAPAPAPVLALLALAPGEGETAVVCGELRRAAGGWDFRAGGAGYTGGLPALAASYGIAPAGRAPSSPPAGTPPVRAAAPGPPPHATDGAAPSYGYPQPDPAFTLPPQGPQFLN
ncbi:TerD family protein [Streptomyces sp. DSM 44917]|uniref:TerD family protein n=1 Tax=Streptomyces boetiae TaxID=3075541 RepID=A0ABU2L3Z3_9ACTN|nr:TerD family protein [Streptomyces sp. DSM 44917]MDT0306043.1 TerD family protein [Streptomyces sp. DSM 44917]